MTLNIKYLWHDTTNLTQFQINCNRKRSIDFDRYNDDDDDDNEKKIGEKKYCIH